MPLDSLDYDRAVDMIIRNGGRLLELVNQLLDLAKLDSNRLNVHYIQADVIPYFRYLLEAFHSYGEMKGIQLSFQSPLSALVMDYDPERLQQIISNLLSNAIKFTPKGGQVALSVQLADEDHHHPALWIQVKDTGKGIAQALLPYIFNRFYQVDSSSTRAGEGTGIGLALTKELVDLMEGTISVESEVNEGSIFHLYLPITNRAPIQMAPLEEIQSYPSIDSQFDSEEAILTSAIGINEMDTSDTWPILLIIEDNKDVSRYLASCVKDQFQIAFAYDGEEGIEKAVEMVPDLIISDVMMPKKDGLEVCQYVKQHETTSHIPIVLLTAKATQSDKVEGN